MNKKINSHRYSWYIKDTYTGRFVDFTGYFETKEQAIKWKRTHGKYFEKQGHEFRLRNTKPKPVYEDANI